MPRNPRPTPPRDPTEERLLEAAGHVFAETGFQQAKVRDICARAKVNLAAVNYHFGDKLGLYNKVLRRAACVAGDAASFDPALWRPDPQAALRTYVHGVLQQMYGGGQPAWPVRIMTHELAQPTPALDGVVNRIMRPRYAAACALVGSIIGRPPEDRTTRLCTQSVMGQIIMYAHGREVLKRLWPELKFNPETLSEIADHIAAFSYAALKSFARRPRPKTSAAGPHRPGKRVSQ
ncbi:MAG: CerR family C-terminal domain-containing protein [Bryobacteraceae bacterium]|jgi:TetR/AcrR family transcriptional regulator, regulator of cefoperazone and chloramphenicol sensitivity